MKRILFPMLLLLALCLCVPALAEGAALPSDAEDFLPYEVRKFFADAAFSGYTVRSGASAYFENTVGGTFFFTVAQKDGHNVLYGFEEKNGKFNYWMKTDSAIPQGGGFFELSHLYGQQYMVFFDEPIYLGDTLSIIFTRSDYEEQPDSAVWFEVNKNGQWNLTWAFFSYCWEGARVDSDRATYYLDEGAKVETVKGVTERNLRYFSWDAFPKNLKAARESLSNPPAIPTGELSAQRVKFQGGQKYPVYSGPGEQYERAAGSKAAVSTNDWIQVFGSENGYILIQYDITSAQMRFGWIEQSALPKGVSAAPLRFAYADAMIVSACPLTHDPLNSRAAERGMYAGETVKWLAVMGDWVYVEAADVGKPIRGFVPKAAVRQADQQTVFSETYKNDEYEAQAVFTVTETASGTKTLDVTLRLLGSSAWNGAGADRVTGYRLYANQSVLAELTNGVQNPGEWDYTFSAHAALPDNAAVLGLCPVYAVDGPRADEMIVVTYGD